MDFNTVQQRLGDLPTTFLRQGNVFAAWEASQAYQLSQYTYGADSIIPQTSFSSANYGWLDVWGELFDILRNNNEGNQTYQNRISFTLQSPVGTLYAIKAYSTFYFGYPTTVTENTSGVGYTITIPNLPSLSGMPQYLINLERIRPAGIPFSVIQTFESNFLNTFQYVGGQNWAGAYLGGGNINILTTIPEPITNSQPLLPSILLTDPSLNGQT